MKAAAETTLAVAADAKHFGARIGITAVLHTWGSALTHHPHVHMIVPGGGLSLDGARWVAARSDFLVDVNVLARLFSGKMLAMTFKRFLAPLRRIKWVVAFIVLDAVPFSVTALVSASTRSVRRRAAPSHQ